MDEQGADKVCWWWLMMDFLTRSGFMLMSALSVYLSVCLSVLSVCPVCLSCPVLSVCLPVSLPVCKKRLRSRKSHKSKNEQSKAFLMTPPTECIHFVLSCPRWRRATGVESSRKSNISLESQPQTYPILPDFGWPLLLNDYIFKTRHSTSNTWRECAYECARVCWTCYSRELFVRICVLTIKSLRYRKSHKSNNEQSKALLLSPPTEWIHLFLCWPRLLRASGYEN